MSAPINNINDLRNEIARLRVVKVQQEEAIKEHFKSPSAVFNTFFPHFLTPDAKGKPGFFNIDDLIGLASRFILPFALNKTLFRSSNFIVKALVGLVSQQASGFINEKNLASAWDKIKGLVPAIKNLIPQKWTKKTAGKPVDYGIPPLSESY